MKLKRKEREIKKNMKTNNYSYIILCLNANLGVISLGQPSLENCEKQDWKSLLPAYPWDH
jgi:hypothetical protein